MDQQSIEEQEFVQRYVTGRLSPDEAARFEEYFLEHPDCAAEVQAAQRLQRGLTAVAAQEAIRTSLLISLWSRLLKSPSAMLVSVLALAVVITPLVLQTRRIGHLEESLEAAQQPQVNTPIFELSSFRSPDFDTAIPQLLTLSPDPERIVLALALPDAGQPTYRVALRDAQKSLVWEAAGLRPDPLGRLVMTLPSTLLPAGDYRISAAESSGDPDSAPVVHFALRVVIGP